MPPSDLLLKRSFWAAFVFAVVIGLYFYGLSMVREHADLAQDNKDLIQAESDRNAALKALAEAKRVTQRNNERIAELSRQLEVLAAQRDDEEPEPQVHNSDSSPTSGGPTVPAGEKRAIPPTRPSVGPSFDCAKATYRSEHLVCSSSELAVLDLAMANAYRDAIARAKTKGRKSVDLQNYWLRRVREACADIACLRGTYEQRIRELNAMNR